MTDRTYNAIVTCLASLLVFGVTGVIVGYWLPRYTLAHLCNAQLAQPPAQQPAPLVVYVEGRTLPPTVAEVERYITKVALEMRVDPKLALEVARQESGLELKIHAVRVERNGTLSLGVYQLNEVIVKELGVDDALEWRQNVLGGVGYLGRLVKKYGGDKPGAAGAAGVARVKCAWVHGEGSRVCIDR